MPSQGPSLPSRTTVICLKVSAFSSLMLLKQQFPDKLVWELRTWIHDIC